MKKLAVTLIIVSVSFFTLFAASGVGVTSLNLKGSVSPKSFLEITQTLGATPGALTSIPLDEGEILSTESGIGVNVGDWSVSSNGSSNLILKITYTPFTATISSVLQSIDYIVNNGTSWVNSGDEFIPLVKTTGYYTEANNSGSIYLKRTDNASYPPSYSYVANVTFSLETE